MAASFKDMDVLRQNATLQGRVRAAIIQGSISVGLEADTVGSHRERATYCAQIMNNPDAFAPLFTSAVVTDVTVIGQATQSGTVAITAANSDAQQALITDAAITAAVAAQFNAFFRRPA